MAEISLNISQISMSSQLSNEEDAKCFCDSYTYDDLKEFLADSSLKKLLLPYVHEITLAKPLFTRFIQALSCDLTLSVDQLCDLYILSIIMMTYQEEDQLIMLERLKLVEVIGNLTDHLDLEDIIFIAFSIYEKFVISIDRIEKVIALLASMPAIIRASALAADIAVSLLLIILAKYTKTPRGLEMGQKQLENGFNMIQLIDWQHLDVSGRHAEMFMVIKSFGLIINCRRMREACPDRVGNEIREYFLKISKSIDHSSTYGMMVERYIAYCVIRGVCTSNTTPTDLV
ncbi:uncharacterized protein Dwil_GK11784 [Drosophila willistoni]|uniref:Uncharacterized protein n=1 Tax=Drosophila willistoni TaxID=7260 RepID=B4NAV4_DROWI|nr:uncharacterized protein LOC6647359 [Drosophila willistoni]EDW80918.1 uncharacterized protein Dwil_GK11784 [Drosophila willistoni]